MEQSESIGEKHPRIRRGRVDSLSLYGITDYELEILEKGSPSSIYLNLAIFLLSIATSFLIALCTSTIASVRTFTVFVVLIVVGYVVGIFLLLLWLRDRKSVPDIVKKIKNRIPSEAMEESEVENQG